MEKSQLQIQYDQLSQRHVDYKRHNQARLDAEGVIVAKLKEEVDRITQQYVSQKRLNKLLVKDMETK